ncbi:MAG: hypothetical protein KDI29_14315, partial [Pseudomonadales bacterium]|nr:hypothetical protein [Pseudomonadales bacterium]
MTLFRTLDEQLDVQTAGGKGYHLSCLASLKMPVPEALILDAASYSAWSAQIGSNDDESLKLDPDSALQLSKWLASFPPATRFAVRSSANLEDLGSAACAGQHDSVLNVKPENIPEAIVACYRSLKNDRAVAYRRQHGFDEESATMAVVIQRMIPAEVSGVAFAVNPVSGRLNETLIEANFGLGETVVGGEHATDTWLVKDGELISERRIGNKERVMLAAENGTRLIELPPGRAAMPCLSDAQILEIARISRQLMQKLQQPQDVEWVIQDDRLYLVQARPQTTLPARFTRHEAAERFPNPITPLTWSCVDAAFSESLEFSLHMMSIDLPTRPWFALRDHYVYGNQNAVELLAMKRPVRATTLQELEAEIPGLMRTFHWVSELPSLWQSNLDQFLLSLGALSSEIADGYEIDQFRDYFARIQQAAVTYFRPNIAISMTQAFLVRTLEGVMILSTGDRSRARMLVQKLLSAASLKTGLVNRELQKLASRIQSSPSVKKVFDGGVPKLESLRSLDQDFYDALLEFINRHGHREVDFDFIHPTWGDDPEPVLAILGKLAESDNRTTGDSPQQAWQLRQQ